MEIFQTVTKPSEKKVRKTFGRYEIKFLPLQPFSEKRQTMVDMLNETRWALELPPVLVFPTFRKRDDSGKPSGRNEKESFKKNFRKHLEDMR